MNYKGINLLICLLLLIICGLYFSGSKKMGFLNPFQIYFWCWFIVFLLYYYLQDTFIGISFEYKLALLTTTVFALVLILFFVFRMNNKVLTYKTHKIYFNKHRLRIAQIILVASVPFAYQRASSLSAESIFTALGYMQLRASMNENGENLGVFSYLIILTFVVCSTTIFDYSKTKKGLIWVLVALLTAVFYMYLSTGRTFILLLATMVLYPQIIERKIELKGFLVGLIVLAFLFVVSALMTAKGLSADSGFDDNISSLLENLRSYTLAPLVAMSELFKNQSHIEWGVNTFRMGMAVLYSLGLSDEPPVSLIRQYISVPDLTNVYTVYEVYFRDFGVIGFFIPPFFLCLHWYLYTKAHSVGGVWIFICAASIYPLVMQFFQDQYFSLMSTWVQIAFWNWFFVNNKIRQIH